MSRIITINREFGSGGRELGKRLADALGVPCYDHEIIELIAKDNGFDEQYVANVSETSIEAAYPLTIGHRFAMPVLPVMEQPIRVAVAQRKILENFAEKGDCVIVGRCANYVLRDRDDVLDIFIHAGVAYRLNRAITSLGLSEKQAKKVLRSTDKARKAYYKNYTGTDWNDPDLYHACLNPDRYSIEGCVKLICDMYRS